MLCTYNRSINACANGNSEVGGSDGGSARASENAADRIFDFSRAVRELMTAFEIAKAIGKE